MVGRVGPGDRRDQRVQVVMLLVSLPSRAVRSAVRDQVSDIGGRRTSGPLGMAQAREGRRAIAIAACSRSQGSGRGL